MNPEVTRAMALKILDRMGATGQPPERGARLVNVATGPILDLLRTEYLRPIKASGRNSTFKLIQATFGGGKTHFLHCLRELAWEEGFATAIVGLSPRECPFDKPLSIYRAIAEKVELPVAHLEEEPQPGIDVVLRHIALTRADALGAKEFRAWLREDFRRVSVESRHYLRGVARFMEAVVDDDLEAEEVLGDYLRGEEVGSGTLATFGIRERVDDTNGFKWLRSLVQVLSELDLPGVVLMFDEMDRNMSLPAQRRRAIGDNLRQMIDYCGQSTLRGVVLCYAVPPEFMDTVVPEYPALAQRLKGIGSFDNDSPKQPVIDLEHLSMGPAELFTEIGERLLDLTEIAYDQKINRDTQLINLKLLASELADRSFESGTRRQFVKAAVNLLDGQRLGDERELRLADIEKLLGGSVAAAGAASTPDNMPDEIDF